MTTTTERTALYRLLAANGRLLYVGISSNPDFRWGTHSNKQPWWDEVADRKIEWLDSREAASAAEVAAIKEERPMYNKQHSVIGTPVTAPRQSTGISEPLEDPWADSGPADLLPVVRRRDEGGRGRGGARSSNEDSSEYEPPQDLDAEQSVLGAMLLSKDAIADVVMLAVADFYEAAHKTIFTAILDLYARLEPADRITVAAALTKRGEINRVGGMPYLIALVESVPTAANAKYYAEIVYGRAVQRRLIEAGARLANLGRCFGVDTAKALELAQAEIAAIAGPLRPTMGLLTHDEVYGPVNSEETPS